MVGAKYSQVEHHLDLQRLAGDLVPQGLPLQQFHGNEGSPLGLVDFVDGADVRVVQRGRSFGFPLETAESLRVVGKVVRKELQSHVTAQLEILRLIHNTHAPAPDPAEDAVMGNRLTHWFGGRRHWRVMLCGVEGQVNESHAVGDGSKGWLAQNRHNAH